MEAPPPTAPSPAVPPVAAPRPARRGPSRRVWIALGLAAVFLFFVMQQVLDPYAGAEYVEIPHGSHSHFVPKDRDPDVDVGQFPTKRPGPTERITPQGQVVPR